MNTLNYTAIFIAILMSLFVNILIEKWKLYQIKVPGPRMYPFVIEFFYTLYKIATLDFVQRLKFITQFSHKYDEWVKFWLGPSLVVLVNSPELTHKVLNHPKCTEKSHLIYDLFGEDAGLATRRINKKWKSHRKVLSVPYGANSLKMYRNIIESNANSFCDHIEKI